MLGPGKLGRKQLLEEGLRKGDVIKQVVNGCELFYMKRGFSWDKATDTHGRTASGSMAIDDDDLMMSLQATKEEFADEHWAVFMTKNLAPKAALPPTTTLAQQHLHRLLR